MYTSDGLTPSRFTGRLAAASGGEFPGHLDQFLPEGSLSGSVTNLLSRSVEIFLRRDDLLRNAQLVLELGDLPAKTSDLVLGGAPLCFWSSLLCCQGPKRSRFEVVPPARNRPTVELLRSQEGPSLAKGQMLKGRENFTLERR